MPTVLVAGALAMEVPLLPTLGAGASEEKGVSSVGAGADGWEEQPVIGNKHLNI